MSYGERINNTPLTALPDDVVRISGPIRLMIGRAPERKLSVGLLIDAPPPLGAVEVYLTGPQIHDLAHQLGSLVSLERAELELLIERLHEGNH
ncbi:hypothetical protein [Mycobacterium kansasii]|uniref:hypothetical protein n=1 Tax=Mycobacterium kansasii TaxID=1768 RepID=UPI000CDD89A8|nr:hypothetical protein [Mycobacterium kansasii]POX82188.1 hypothetical protein C3B43_25800 [Mycobacterium kansasii]POY20182.1 hypothetical protein C3476_15890 [Mycobacterium kansasii]